MNTLEPPRLSLRDRLSSLIGQRESALVIVLLVAGIIMSMVSPVFLSVANIEAILLALSMEGTITIGMAILLISGGLDLSVGSTLALTGVVTGLCLNAGVPAVPAILLGLMAALMVGLANGLLVTRLGINPFITTLGMAMGVRGLLLVIAHGRAVINLSSAFTVVGQGRMFGVQYPIYVMLSLVIVGEILVRNARFFRQSYYIGGNERAARLSGINVDLVKIFNYCLVAVLAGVAGLLITGRFGSASVTIGAGLELRVITAAIIGGASLSGGEGSVLGAFLGALFMGFLANALNLLGVDVYWQNLFTGALLILAVVVDVLNERRKTRLQ
ncbi:MAG: ABC transporter permease [Anaerolineales bacterium]|nr:ABC transporter permease [Anaerolineales bacterium]